MTALMMCLAGVSCSGPAPQATTLLSSAPGQESAEVLWVDDGDTIKARAGSDSFTVRLIGVNAPERDECYADAARDYLDAELRGETVAITRYGNDQFGRTLADVWHGSELINVGLVAMGLATALPSQTQYPGNDAVLAAEESAYQQRLGMWSPIACGATGEIPDIEFDLARSELNPDGPDDENLDLEWITIVNRDSRAVDLAGWTLRDGSSRNRLAIPKGVILEPGGELRITSGCESIPSWCGTTSIWNNDGDLALLLDEHGRVVARARY